MGFGAIMSLVGLGALGVFAVQNRDDVTIAFLGWDFTWPIWLLTIASALLGAMIWFGLGVIRRRQRRKERRDDRR
jgi:uncharacterized integral membrane protein